MTAEIRQRPRYLFTDINVKHDFTFSNALYFSTEQERDIYINSLFQERNQESYKVIIESTDQHVLTNNTNEDTASITIQTPQSFRQLRSKNYLILEEQGYYTFWFITKVKRVKNVLDQFIIQLQRDIIMEYPGIMEQAGSFEMIEGHIDDTYLASVKLYEGERLEKNINVLERDFDWYAQYPNLDINGLNNQWIYCFIKSKNSNDISNKLFKYNGKVEPYRILIAPWEPIIIKENEVDINDLAFPNINFNSVNYEKSTLVEDLTVKDSDIADPTALNDLLSSRLVPTLNDIDPEKPIRIKYNFRGEERIITIPYDSLVTQYGNKFAPIYISNDTQAEIDEVQDNLNNNVSTGEGEVSGTILMMKYDIIGNFFLFEAPDRDKPSHNYDIFKKSDYVSDVELQKLKPDTATYYMNVKGERFGGTGLGFVSTKIEFLDGLKPVGWTSFDISTRVDTSKPGERPDVKTLAYQPRPFECKIIRIFQGEDLENNAILWTRQELIEFINDQINPDETNPTNIISVKVSSFNPLEISSGFDILNIKEYNGTDFGFKQETLMELFKLDTIKTELFNTYNIERYRDKSWIKGLENYSIGIENNKFFDIPSDIIYTNSTFLHSVVPTPNEWTERLVFKNNLHRDDFNFTNTKEMLFATNALNTYSLNNPNQLSNEQSKINNGLLQSTISVAAGIGTAVATGGTSALLSGGLIVSGVNSALSDRQSRKDLKANVADLKEQPALETGSGSAYADVYLNKFGFSLTLTEWQYGEQAGNIIENLIRNGIALKEPVYVNFENIQKQEFNYIKTQNFIEALSKVDIPFEDKSYLSLIYDTVGVRLWYNAENFLNFNVENGGFVTRDIINYTNNNLQKD